MIIQNDFYVGNSLGFRTELLHILSACFLQSFFLAVLLSFLTKIHSTFCFNMNGSLGVAAKIAWDKLTWFCPHCCPLFSGTTLW